MLLVVVLARFICPVVNVPFAITETKRIFVSVANILQEYCPCEPGLISVERSCLLVIAVLHSDDVSVQFPSGNECQLVGNVVLAPGQFSNPGFGNW